MNKDSFSEEKGIFTYFISAGNVDLHFMNYLSENSPDMSKLSRTFHTHAFTEIFCCPDEDYSVYVDNYQVTLKQGDFLIIPSGCSHIKDPDTDASWKSMLITFEKRREKGGADFYGEMRELFGNGKLLLIKGDKKLCESFEKISNVREKELSPATFLEITSFFVKLFSAKHELIGSYKQTDVLNIKEAFDFERLFAIVNHNNKSKLTLTEAAKIMCVSERQLTRYCRKFFGKSYYGIALDTQLKTAAYYLTYTDKSIEEIAEVINMNTTFTRNFTKLYNVTPSEYRKNTAVTNKPKPSPLAISK